MRSFFRGKVTDFVEMVVCKVVMKTSGDKRPVSIKYRILDSLREGVILNVRVSLRSMSILECPIGIVYLPLVFF